MPKSILFSDTFGKTNIRRHKSGLKHFKASEFFKSHIHSLHFNRLSCRETSSLSVRDKLAANESDLEWQRWRIRHTKGYFFFSWNWILVRFGWPNDISDEGTNYWLLWRRVIVFGTPLCAVFYHVYVYSARIFFQRILSFVLSYAIVHENALKLMDFAFRRLFLFRSGF